MQAHSHFVHEKNTTSCMHGCINPTITYNEFIYNELRPYSVESLRRSIPSMLDGLKPSQRKVLLIGETSLRKHKFKTFLLMCLTLRPTTMVGEVWTRRLLGWDKILWEAIILINLALPMGQFGARYNRGEIIQHHII